MNIVRQHTLDFHALSDRGRGRTRNEDAFYANDSEGLFIVADGMGGEPAGVVASEIVVEVLPLLIRKRAHEGRSEKSATGSSLREAVCELSGQLRSRSREQAELKGMGSAAVVLHVSGHRACIAHLGDCRAYLQRGSSLKQLTNDHSLVQLLLDAGELQPDEAAVHPARGQLTRFVGMANEPLPDLCFVDIEPGDKFLLCSDGLTATIAYKELLEIIRQSPSALTICNQLLRAAIEANGKDDVTALIISVPVKRSQSPT